MNGQMNGKKIRLAILGASEIAFRRFLPALKLNHDFEYAGVAIYRKEDEEKANDFKAFYGGEIIKGFETVFSDPSIDAVYIPQPPALHYQFGRQALMHGKHVFMEKPFCDSLERAVSLIDLAKQNNLAATENYMFRFHDQIERFIEISTDGTIGKINKYEVRFSFPLRSKNDFRYEKELGGGALLDCGGYVLMLSTILLGKQSALSSFRGIYETGYKVDMGGIGTMVNSDGATCDFSYSMDAPYCCYAKAFGDKGTLIAPRILTAPNNLEVEFFVEDLQGHQQKIIRIGKDDSFLKSINNFETAINDEKMRNDNFDSILNQAKLVEEVKSKL